MEESYSIATQDLASKFVSKKDIYNRLTVDRKKIFKRIYSTILSSFNEKVSVALHQRRPGWQKRS